MINILFIHQSAELYGSDKTLLLLLEHLDRTKFYPVVVLPFDGPLKKELEKHHIKVVLAPVLKLYRKMFHPKNIAQFLKDRKTSLSVLDELNTQHPFDLVYSNTLAVLLGVYFAKKTKIKHLWHVHEIIASPKIFTKLFTKLLSSAVNTKIIYNSKATALFWNTNPKIISKSELVLNGLETNNVFISEADRLKIRLDLFRSKNEIIIALVGRISRWKGQLFLLESFYELSKKNENIKLVFIGSPPPNQEGFLENLNSKIAEYKMGSKVVLLPFQEDIFTIWQAIDIAVVPSTEPEPFGLVAVEAMLAKKPVVASNHGGLTEIVVQNETGFLVEPNNKEALSEALQKLVENPELRADFGEKGYQRALSVFSVEKYVQEFENLFHNLTNQ